MKFVSEIRLWLSFPLGWLRNKCYRNGYTRVGRVFENAVEVMIPKELE